MVNSLKKLIEEAWVLSVDSHVSVDAPYIINIS